MFFFLCQVKSGFNDALKNHRVSYKIHPASLPGMINFFPPNPTWLISFPSALLSGTTPATICSLNLPHLLIPAFPPFLPPSSNFWPPHQWIPVLSISNLSHHHDLEPEARPHLGATLHHRHHFPSLNPSLWIYMAKFDIAFPFFPFFLAWHMVRCAWKRHL